MEIRKSETTGHLVAALAAASAEFQPITKNKVNPYYNRKYADLASLIDATRPALAKNGLAVIQAPAVLKDRAVAISTMLAHSSGEFMAFDLLMPAVQRSYDEESGQVKERFDAQTIGIATTYGRRYSYASILNLAADEDDDGNGIVDERQGRRQGKTNGNGTNGHSKAAAPAEEREANPNDPIKPFQVNGFLDACKKSRKTNQQVVEYLGSIGCEELAEMRQADFKQAIQWAMGVQ